jgi:integrase
MADGKLNALSVRRLKKPGHHGDGGGLYLRIGEGRRSWMFRYKRAGKTVWLGLGPERDVTLAEARELAREQRRLLLKGISPIEHRAATRAAQKAAAGHPFKTVAELYIEAHKPGWRNAKHAAQWSTTLERHAYPVIGTMPVAAVLTEHVLRLLQPIWTELPETASRVRGRVEAILNYSAAQGWRSGDNPARWRGHLDHLLPPRSKVARVVHHPALPWQGLPAVMAKLSARNGTAARCLAFLVLTAARSGEAREARWSELDLDAAVWAVPPERMKAGREHRVPLAPQAVAILEAMLPLRQNDEDLVFPGGRAGRPLSDVAVSKALRAAGGVGVTVHGCRSSFRDWCGEAVAVPREVAEAALAHTNRDKVEAAYLRSDLFERRRKLMADWADFCIPPSAAANVARMRRLG